MFAMFKNWQAQHHPNYTTAWGKAAAAQLMQHNKFLLEVLSKVPSLMHSWGFAWLHMHAVQGGIC